MAGEASRSISIAGERLPLATLFPPDGDPDRALQDPACTLVKLQRKVMVGRWTTKDTDVFIKRYNVFAWRVALAGAFLGSPARRAVANARGLAERGFSVPPLVGSWDEWRFGLLCRSFFVTQAVDGETLDAWWSRWRTVKDAFGAHRRRAFLVALARLFRDLHSAGVYHADLKDVNILVRENGDRFELTMLDLERVRFGSVSNSNRCKNLVQIARTLGRMVPAAAWARFLRHYLPDETDRTVRHRWARRVLRAARALDRQRGTGAIPDAQVTAAIVCQDEERHIAACVASVRWCDAVVAVDGGSRDRTVALAESEGALVLSNPWPGYRAQKQFAFDRTTTPWVLSIDADERVTPELAAEMSRAIAAAPTDVDGFTMPRLVPYLGRWWVRGGWYPRPVLRLVRRAHARWGGVDPHDRLEVPGRVQRLRSPLVHHSYSDIGAHLRTVVRFSRVAADERRGRRVGSSRLVLDPSWRFVRSWILRRACCEGVPGLFVAATDGFYAFLRQAILWQRRGGSS